MRQRSVATPLRWWATLGSGNVARVDQAGVLAQVVGWAEDDENVRAVVLEGSVLRDDGSVDEWSDLDVRLYVSAPEPPLQSREWFEQFGKVPAIEALENPGWYPTRLVHWRQSRHSAVVVLGLDAVNPWRDNTKEFQRDDPADGQCSDRCRRP
jgi:hypothetical protein